MERTLAEFPVKQMANKIVVTALDPEFGLFNICTASATRLPCALTKSASFWSLLSSAKLKISVGAHSSYLGRCLVPAILAHILDVKQG